MNVSEGIVLEELKKVIDPELFVNIVDLGLVYKVDIHAAGDADADVAGDEASAVDGSAADQASETAESTGGDDNQPAKEGDASESASESKAEADGELSGDSFRVAIEMTLTSPMCPAGPQLVGQAKQFVGDIDGVEEVDVKVVMDPPWSTDRMSEDARDQLNIW